MYDKGKENGYSYNDHGQRRKNQKPFKKSFCPDLRIGMYLFNEVHKVKL